MLLVAALPATAPRVAKPPPPLLTSKLTGMLAKRLLLASVTMAMKGSGSGWPTTPVWLLPESTTTSCGAPGVAVAAKSAVAATPEVLASTRLLPTPARLPSL